MLFKVIGKNRKGESAWLCNMPAASFEEAQAKALDRYGSLYVERIEELNTMCDGCARLGDDCGGTANKIWAGCIYKVHKVKEA